MGNNRTMDKPLQVRKFECISCPRTFLYQSKLMRHSVAHGDVKRFNCDSCQQTYKYVGNLIKHKIQKHHFKDPKTQCYTCHQCEMSFLDHSNLAAHQRTHSDWQHKCKYCLKPFSSCSKLNRHMDEFHLQQPTTIFGCEICRTGFSCRHSFLKHQQNVHNRIKSHPCVFCSKEMSSKFTLGQHIRGHIGEKPFFCKTCDLCFRTKRGLVNHQQSHTGEKIFSHCTGSFFTYYQLKKHVIKEHETKHLLKRHVCRFCSWEFMDKANLDRHYRSHAN